MQFLKSTVADFQLRSRVSRCIAELTNNSRLDLKPADCEICVELAREHPKIVLYYIHERMSSGSPTATYLSIVLLDVLVNSCSYTFHEFLASDEHIQGLLVTLASERSQSESQRRVRSVARTMVLDFSRMFFDDPRLAPLSLLADKVERKTGKKLLRSIQVEKANVRIIEPRPEDIVLISPVSRNLGGRGSSFATVLATARPTSPPEATTRGDPPLTQLPQYWACEGCTFVNALDAEKCTACGLKKPLLEGATLSSPTTTRPPSHHLGHVSIHPPHGEPSPNDAPEESTAHEQADAPFVAPCEDAEGGGQREAENNDERGS